MRSLLVVGNWKMHGSLASNSELVTTLLDAGKTVGKMVICAPYVYLAQLKDLLGSGQIAYGAQDVSVHIKGAYTSEVSVEMLKDLGCNYVIVGHSERRQYHHESNLLVGQKAFAAIQAGLTPIICLGESLEQKQAEQTLEIINEQLSAVKSVIGEQGLRKSAIAYEPVWAIGTGLTASPEQAQHVHNFIRRQLGQNADKIHLLYGGSVKAANAKKLFEQADIDGALVGGASLIADEFLAIANAA
ncbi:MAG: triosephosphate isomerase [Cellvibrionaceae bacterium]|jgi:triosephosphate isomerase